MEKRRGNWWENYRWFRVVEMDGKMFFVQTKTVPPLPSLFLWSVPNFVCQWFQNKLQIWHEVSCKFRFTLLSSLQPIRSRLKSLFVSGCFRWLQEENKVRSPIEVVISVLSFGEWSCFGVSITFFAFWEWSGKKKDLHLAVEQEAPCLGQSLTWPKVAQIRLGPRRVISPWGLVLPLVVESWVSCYFWRAFMLVNKSYFTIRTTIKHRTLMLEICKVLVC